MRVLHVVDTLDQDPSWFRTALAGMLVALRERGVFSDIISRDSDEALPPFQSVETVVTIDNNGQSLHPNTFAPLVANADVLHIHCAQTAVGKQAMLAARGAGTPFVISSYGSFLTGVQMRNRLSLWIENLRLRKYHRWSAGWCCNCGGERELVQARGFRPSCDILPVGFDADMMPSTNGDDTTAQLGTPGTEKRLVAYFGDIDGHNGLVPLFRACNQLDDEFENWKIVLAGRARGNSANLLKARAQRWGKEHIGDLIVNPSASQRAATLRAAEFVVVPSPTPAPPLAAWWAMWNETPVLLSSAVGEADIESAGAGMVVEPSRKGFLVGMARMLSKSPDELREMGKAARAWVRNARSWPNIIDRYEDVYQRAIRNVA